VKRLIQPEFLDELSQDDPRAIHSRRDLRRVNAWMGNHKIMARALKENFSGAPKQIVELGAGDGNFLLRVAKNLNWQNVGAILLDCQKIVLPKTLAAFSKLGWRAEILTADVFDWSKNGNAAEIVIANLFLHHFENARLAELFQKISARADIFIAIEPRRSRLAFPCAQTLRFIGCGPITRHDAEISIRAGFDGEELSALWPKKWQLTERSAGWFGHLFVAKKIS
jgi:2-polyprenyl-3-methyl-5-hydroxy-6-metoxy-1,4-benzoquinol methylase